MSRFSRVLLLNVTIRGTFVREMLFILTTWKRKLRLFTIIVDFFKFYDIYTTCYLIFIILAFLHGWRYIFFYTKSILIFLVVLLHDTVFINNAFFFFMNFDFLELRIVRRIAKRFM